MTRRMVRKTKGGRRGGKKEEHIRKGGRATEVDKGKRKGAEEERIVIKRGIEDESGTEGDERRKRGTEEERRREE